MKGSYTRKYIYIYNVNRALFRWVALNTHAPFQREREREGEPSTTGRDGGSESNWWWSSRFAGHPSPHPTMRCIYSFSMQCFWSVHWRNCLRHCFNQEGSNNTIRLFHFRTNNAPPSRVFFLSFITREITHDANNTIFYILLI